MTPGIADFLLARIAEDEAAASLEVGRRDVILTGAFAPAFILAECAAKRRIVEWHQSWPVLVETPPRFDSVPGDANQMTYRLTQRIAWTTQEEYRKRFGSEPPTAPILQLLALPYADHPDYDEAWRP